MVPLPEILISLMGHCERLSFMPALVIRCVIRCHRRKLIWSYLFSRTTILGHWFFCINNLTQNSLNVISSICGLTKLKPKSIFFFLKKFSYIWKIYKHAFYIYLEYQTYTLCTIEYKYSISLYILCSKPFLT